jgi:hypothetical protein
VRNKKLVYETNHDYKAGRNKTLPYVEQCTTTKGTKNLIAKQIKKIYNGKNYSAKQITTTKERTQN